MPLSRSLLESVESSLDTNVHELKCTLEQREFSHSELNVACLKAMDLSKINFVALLLRHGATPSSSQLVSKIKKSCEHPTILQYLSGWTTTDWASTVLDSEVWCYDYAEEKVSQTRAIVYSYRDRCMVS